MGQPLDNARAPMSEAESLAYAKRWGLRAESLAAECRARAAADDIAGLVRAAKALSRELWLRHPEIYGKSEEKES